MLITSLNLEGAKSVDTPSIKQPNDDEDPDIIDVDAAVVIRQILAEAKRPRPTAKEYFSGHIRHHSCHPRTFHFSKHGAMLCQRSNVEP